MSASTNLRRLISVLAASVVCFFALPQPAGAQTAVSFDSGKEGEIWQGLTPFGKSVTSVAACTPAPWNVLGIAVCAPTEACTVDPSDPTCVNGERPRPTRPRLDELDQPYGVAVLDPGPGDGSAAATAARLSQYQVFTADHRGNRVVSFDYNGNPVRRYGSTVDSRNPDGSASVPEDQEYPRGQLLNPMGIAVDPVGETLLVGGYNGHIDAFDTGTGASKWMFLMPGGPGWAQRFMAVDIAIAPGTVVQPPASTCSTLGSGRIAVAVWPDVNNPFDPAPGVTEQQVIVYDEKFCTVGTLGQPNPDFVDLGPGFLTLPTGVHIDRFQIGTDGNGQPVYDYRYIVVDSNNKIEAYSSAAVAAPQLADKLPIARLVGVFPKPQGDPSVIQYPYFMTVDRHGRWMVADTSNQRIAVYTPDYVNGTATYEFEFRAAGSLIGNPRGIAEDASGRLFTSVVRLSGSSEGRDIVQPFDRPGVAVYDLALSSTAVQRNQAFDFSFSLLVPNLKPPVLDAEPLLTYDPNVLQLVSSAPAIIPQLNPLAPVRYTVTFKVLDHTPGTAMIGIDARGTPTGNPGEYAAHAFPKSTSVALLCDTCETVPPTITAAVTKGTLIGSTYVTPIEITLTATDVGRGDSQISKIFWQFIEGGASNPTPSQRTFSPLADPATVLVPLGVGGASRLEYWAVDGSGIVSAHGQLLVNLDLEPPMIRFTLPSPVAQSPDGWKWWTGPVNVPVTVTDNVTPSSGIVWVQGGPALLFDQDGRKQEQIVVVQDAAGNRAQASTTFTERGGGDVNIDTRAPVTTVDKPGGSTIYQEGTTITLTANDVVPPPTPSGVAIGSGAARIFYTLSQCDPVVQVNGQCPENVVTSDPQGRVQTVTLALPPGTTTVSLYSQDWAGNKEGARSLAYVVNRSPVGGPDTATTDEDAAATIDVLANDSDPDGDPISLTAVGTATNGAATIVNGKVLYTPNANYFGPDSFTYTVSDNRNGSRVVLVTITVTSVNDPPVANADAIALDEDTTGTVNVLTNDTDVEHDPLTVTAVTQGASGTVTFTAAGVVTYTPAPDSNGADSFTYTVSDANGGTATGTVTVTVRPVNDRPVGHDDVATGSEDTAIDVAVLANDTDVDGDTLAVVGVTQAANGPVSINPDGTVRYVPNPNFNGTDTFTYTVSDGKGGTAMATVRVVIDAVNDPPVANADAIALDEDTTGTVNVLTNDTDVEHDPLTVTAVTQGASGTVTFTAAGVVTYTPAPDSNGADSFTYTVSDGNGGTATGTVGVTVRPVNDAPAAADDARSVNEDSAADLPVLANDTDVDGDGLSVAAVSLATHGTVTINPDGTLHYVPNANYSGADSFTYTVTDGHGGTSTATVRLTVEPVNDAPAAGADIATVTEDGSVSIDVLANDTDIDGDTLAIAAVTQPANGSVTILNGQVVYTPTPDFNGTDTFTYRVSDGNGGTATATVTVTVAPVNDPPVAVDDPALTDVLTPITIDVVANDTDADRDTLTLQSVGTTPNAAVSLTADGKVRYVPNGSFVGTDTFTYVVADGQGGTAVGTVSVTVAFRNRPPVANPDAAAVDEDSSVAISVLANDGDIDGGMIRVTAVTQPANGTVTFTATDVTYSPRSNFNGADSFTYTIADGQGGFATATVSVTVRPVNDPPVAGNDSVTVTQGQTLVIPVLANDTDADLDPLTVTAVSTPRYGHVTVNADGAIAYTASATATGVDTFTYTVSDGNGGTATATVTVTLRRNNRPPVCDAAEANPGMIWPPNHKKTVPIQIGGVTDPDGDAVTLVVTGIFQDEPTNTRSDGDTWIDGGGVGTASPWVRAERMGTGNGRVYEIRFTATDAKGDSCPGTVLVGVPHDQGQGIDVMDSGVRYDSTVPGAPYGNTSEDDKKDVDKRDVDKRGDSKKGGDKKGDEKGDEKEGGTV